MTIWKVEGGGTVAFTLEERTVVGGTYFLGFGGDGGEEMSVSNASDVGAIVEIGW